MRNRTQMPLIHALESAQIQQPMHIALAHDLGRLYFNLIQSADNSPEQTIIYWQKVIANWAIVLEDNVYWQIWPTKREAVYERPISPDTVADARERLWQMLLLELTRFDEQARHDLPYHDSMAIQLQSETAALHLLKQIIINSAHVPHSSELVVAPTMLRQMNKEQEFGKFIAVQIQNHGISDNFLPMLHTLLGEQSVEVLSTADMLGQLMLYYSQLGGALVYIQKQQYKAAVSFLRHMQCQTCTPLADRPITPEGKRAIAICQPDCPQFAHNNPAYAAVHDRWNRLWSDTIKLAIEVHLLGIRDLIGDDNLEQEEIRSLWKNAVNLAWYDGLKNTVRQRINELIRIRVAALEKEGKWEQVVCLLETVVGIEESENKLFVNLLARMLNYLGVSKTKDRDWAEATSVFNKAYQLNPKSNQIRENLILLLDRYADQLAAEKKFTQACEVLEELETTLQQIVATSPTPREKQIVEEQLAEAAFKRRFAYQEFWHQSPLFNQAINEGLHLDQHYLSVAHLFIALTKLEGKLTQQLVYQLGIPPVVLRCEIRQHIGFGDDHPHWEFAYFTPRLRRVLLRAIDLARRRNSMALDEPDFLYAIIQEPDSAPMQTIMTLGLPVHELPYWRPAPLTPPGQYDSGTIVFQYLSGPEDGKFATFNRESIVIGRAFGNELVLPFDALVSRYHARLTITESDIILEDLKSSSGTYLGVDMPVTVPVPITPSTLFKVGQTWFRIWHIL